MKTLLKTTALIFALLLAGCEQAQVDAQMAELCAKDGGMKIYETVVLPKEQFTEFGDPKFFVTWNEQGGDYSFLSNTEHIKKTAPTLQKTRYLIVRQSDSKVLGSYIVYLRRGGDVMPRLGPDSAKDCPESASSKLFVRTIFTIKKEG